MSDGMLTAEQVKDAWCGNLKRDCLYDPPTPDWQAIADELNAMLGNRTCEMHRDKYGVWHCSSCEKGADKITGSDGALESWNDSWPPNYCPYCGAKVVDE